MINNENLNDPTPDLIAEFSDADAVDESAADHEGSAINCLTALGNQAVRLKLIAGHGFHQGQYELLREGQFLLMTPVAAQHYLEDLISAADK